jgi:hypothetical protein
MQLGELAHLGFEEWIGSGRLGSGWCWSGWIRLAPQLGEIDGDQPPPTAAGIRQQTLSLHVGHRKAPGEHSLDEADAIAPHDDGDQTARQERQLVVAQLSAEWHATFELREKHLSALARRQLIELGVSLGETFERMVRAHYATSHSVFPSSRPPLRIDRVITLG